MSVVHVIDTDTEWARQNVCEHILLKVPPRNEDAVDADYEYKTANPVAFPMYVPTSEKLPPNIHSPFPSLCVRFVKGANTISSNAGHVDLQLCFSVWNPGTHEKDIFYPNGDGSFRQGSGVADFSRNGDGWRDAWNFVDIALRAVESTTCIGDYAIDQATPVEYGPLVEQEAIADYYPMWFAWVSFRVNYPLRRNIPSLKNFL